MRVTLLPFKDLDESRLGQLYDAASASVRAFGAATKVHGSMIQTWVAGQAVTADTHYPAGELVDSKSGSQAFYHCHRPELNEHGHLHLFYHATKSGKRRYFSSKQAASKRWLRTAPSHLLAIGFNAHGLPISLFTVNRWVTGGHWFDAHTTLSCIKKFSLAPSGQFRHGKDWLTQFLRLYAPLIEILLMQRDAALAKQAKRVANFEAALDDESLENLSWISIDWQADLARLEKRVLAR
jgi:hypothetical protein